MFLLHRWPIVKIGSLQILSVSASNFGTVLRLGKIVSLWYRHGHEGFKIIKLTAGKIVAGRWAQFHHCSTPSCEGRMSFVLYLDYRMLKPEYVAK